MWVFAEETEGTAPASALEALTKTRAWGDVDVFYVGPGSDAAFAALGDHGARKVYHLESYLKPVHFNNLGLLLGTDQVFGQAVRRTAWSERIVVVLRPYPKLHG